jgi:hypothetical protein
LGYVLLLSVFDGRPQIVFSAVASLFPFLPDSPHTNVLPEMSSRQNVKRGAKDANAKAKADAEAAAAPEPVVLHSYTRAVQSAYRRDERGLVGEERVLERERHGAEGHERQAQRRVLNDEELITERERDLGTGARSAPHIDYHGTGEPKEFEARWSAQATGRAAIADTKAAPAGGAIEGRKAAKK